jgi:hypothetical protein
MESKSTEAPTPTASQPGGKTSGSGLIVNPRETQTSPAVPAAPTLEEFQAVLSEARYAIKDFDTLKGVLDDAFTLYDVRAGKGRVSDLLAVIEKQTDPEVFSLIVFDLPRFLQPRLRKAVAELLELQQEHTSTVADALAPVLERRLTAVQAMKGRIHELWAAAAITDTSSAQFVEAEIWRQIRGDAAAIGRIENGDFGDADPSGGEGARNHESQAAAGDADRRRI